MTKRDFGRFRRRKVYDDGQPRDCLAREAQAAERQWLRQERLTPELAPRKSAPPWHDGRVLWDHDGETPLFGRVALAPGPSPAPPAPDPRFKPLPPRKPMCFAQPQDDDLPPWD